MDSLPHSLLLQTLSLLDDSADAARCRLVSKAFDTVYPDLRSINLRSSLKWYKKSKCRVSDIEPVKTVFLQLISKLRVVESVRIGPAERQFGYFDPEINDLYLMDDDFVKEWLPRVSHSLKSLSIDIECGRQSNVLRLISEYCHNLVSLKLKYAWLSVDTLNPMLMLTSLTVGCTRLIDQHLNEFNNCFPNLQVLNLVGVSGLENPKIHLLNLQTCRLAPNICPVSLTLITPNLITFDFTCLMPVALHIEAPLLSHFHLGLNVLQHPGAITLTKFENLKTLWLEYSYGDCWLSEFPITKTVENLTLDSGGMVPTEPNFTTLGKVFTVFPDVTSLCINSGAWSEIEACSNPEGWEILDGKKGLKTVCVALELVDPSLTFSSVACVLDQCIGLSEVSLLIDTRVDGTVSETFKSECMARWPGLKWRWGVWGEDTKDFWLPDTYAELIAW